VRAKFAQLDPDRRLYLDYDKLNDGQALEPQRAASRRWTGDFSAIIQVFCAILGAL
jgi:hypothetical protein